MPKLDVRQDLEQVPKTLADVPIGEWWLDKEGIPYQRENTDECVYYEKRNKTFCRSSMFPQEINVKRKI